MTSNIKIIIIISVLVVIIGLFGLLQKKPRKLNKTHYKKNWARQPANVWWLLNTR